MMVHKVSKYCDYSDKEEVDLRTVVCGGGERERERDGGREGGREWECQATTSLRKEYTPTDT